MDLENENFLTHPILRYLQISLPKKKITNLTA